MTSNRQVAHAVAIAGIGLIVAVAGSTAAHAEPDNEFAAQLHTYGIYGPTDYDAWLGKIVCQRMDNNVDHDVDQSTKFVAANLNRRTSAEQARQFLGTAIDFYCPERHLTQERPATHPSIAGDAT